MIISNKKSKYKVTVEKCFFQGKEYKVKARINNEIWHFFSSKHIQEKSNIYVTMIHGKKDEIVPVSYSKKVLGIFNQAKKKLKIVKNGDHSLSSNRNLKLIIKELNLVVQKIIN